LAALGAELVRIDRGGDITFHGPGQLVAYPIVELRDPLDLRRYVRTLEEAIIGTAAAFGVEAARVEGLPGVWVEGVRKLAAVGVRVKRGVTTHGLALNVSTDLAWFDEMIPCGIPGCAVTSLERELGQEVSLRTVSGRLASELANGFGLRLVELPDA
jgi:lipoyl(octanoyl) transferase